ncbi:branched-chain amino acid ABC transporter permease [Actinomadura viridis]|uniref:branched-chain amino acid ABC transporter permease n=1 Tax=Actinomadura viridis TaxID=58110 RepID=UPI00368E0076
MNGLAQVTVYGVLQGGLLAAVAVGFSLIWGLNKIINVAHGEFVMLGAYVTWRVNETFAADPFVGAFVAMGVLFGAGYLIQRLIINFVVDAPLRLTLLLMFGISVVLEAALVALHSTTYQALPTSYAMTSFTVLEIRVPLGRLLAFAFSVICALAIAAFLNRTGTGLTIRAAGMNRKAARLVGIDIRHSYALTFALGTGLAGAGGAMIALVGTFSPADAATYTMSSFVVAVLGGLGSMKGALAAGVLLGVIQAWAAYLVSGTLTNLIAFGLVLIVLVNQPRGLFGRGTLGGGEER